MRHALLIACITVFAGTSTFGQASENLRFEVASIRPNAANWSERFEQPMGGGYQPGDG
jgi:hypothetical protein